MALDKMLLLFKAVCGALGRPASKVQPCQRCHAKGCKDAHTKTINVLKLKLKIDELELYQTFFAYVASASDFMR